MKRVHFAPYFLHNKASISKIEKINFTLCDQLRTEKNNFSVHEKASFFTWILKYEEKVRFCTIFCEDTFSAHYFASNYKINFYFIRSIMKKKFCFSQKYANINKTYLKEEVEQNARSLLHLNREADSPPMPCLLPRDRFQVTL